MLSLPDSPINWLHQIIALTFTSKLSHCNRNTGTNDGLIILSFLCNYFTLHKYWICFEITSGVNTINLITSFCWQIITQANICVTTVCNCLMSHVMQGLTQLNNERNVTISLHWYLRILSEIFLYLFLQQYVFFQIIYIFHFKAI